MAGPVAAYYQTPDDSGNTGKKLRTQTRVVSANTVHEHMYVSTRKAVVLGVYRACTSQFTIVNAANNGTSTGLLWIHNPSATTNINCRMRRMWMTSQSSAVSAFITAPRILAQRFSLTGTASGAQVAIDKLDSAFGSSHLDIRTAVTGLTVTLIGAISAVSVMTTATAVNGYSFSDNIFIDNGETDAQEDEWEVLRPGEGIVLYQDVAGTSSDTRKFQVNMLFDEIDVA